MMMKRRIYIYRHAASALIVAAFATLASGCLFDTRPVRPPAEGEDVVVFDDPGDVFVGMRKGLEEENTNYERALGDDFIFSPLLSDSLDPTFGPDTFALWTRQVERDVMQLILGASDSLQVEFTPSTEIDENAFVRYRTTYRLSFVPEGGGELQIYAGVAFLDVRLVRGSWQVVYGDEIGRVDDYQTWGYLRGIYRGLLQ